MKNTQVKKLYVSMVILFLAILAFPLSVEAAGKAASTTALKGVAATNVNNWEYIMYHAENVNSHMVDLGDGEYMRVENLYGVVIAEYYSSSNKLQKTVRILSEQQGDMYMIYGGFFPGKEHYYIVYGKDNPKEKLSLETLRVVKYTKDWEKVATCSVKNLDVFNIFQSGSLRMGETEECLYIYTCRTGFESSDGLHHQFSLLVSLNKETMTTRIADRHFASHSFNQFVKTDGEEIYLADHGDAYPRGLQLTKFNEEEGLSSSECVIALKFPGTVGTNSTGAYIGAMEIAEQNVLVVGNNANKSTNMSGARNVFVAVQSKDFSKKATVKYITNYKKGSKYSVANVKLVKLESDKFLLMWNVQDTDNNTYSTKMVLINGAGEKVGSIISTNMTLSQCDPVLMSDGMVYWYAAEGYSPVLYKVDPNRLSEVPSKVKAPSKKYYRTSDGQLYQLHNNKTATLLSVNTSNTYVNALDVIMAKSTSYKVTKIAKKAFANQARVKNINLGRNIKTIGANAFTGCTKLKNLRISSTKIKSSGLSKTTFKGVGNKVKITVPKKKVSAYKKLFRKKGLSKKVKFKGKK